jgi:CheY-like chemotaxis protein
MTKIKCILVIEDDKNLQTALKVKLEANGWSVIQAFNGREGIETLKQDKVDAILLDIAMPIMNGFEFLRTMKADERFKDLKVIIISNSIYEPLRTKDVEELISGTPYLIKSNYSLNDIVLKIKEAVEA